MTLELAWSNNKPKSSPLTDERMPKSILDTCILLEELTALEDNWDSYGAIRPTEKALMGAVRWISELFQEGTPIPDVFPVPNGNIQLEWSRFGFDIEIEIPSISTCFVYVTDLRLQPPSSLEKEFTYDITELASVIAELTRRSESENKPKLVALH